MNNYPAAAYAANKAKARLRAAVTAIDAKVASINFPPDIPPNASAGRILAGIVAAGPGTVKSSADIVRKLRDVRADLYKSLDAARADLDRARKFGSDLISAGTHIEDGSPLPVTMDPLLHSHAVTARKGVLAGSVQAGAGIEIEKLGTAGLVSIAAAEGELERIVSAGRVALAKQTAAVYLKGSQCSGFDRASRTPCRNLQRRADVAAIRRTAEHRRRHSGGRA